MVTVLLLFIVCLVLIFYLFYATSRPRNYPPGPTWLPVVGNLHTVKKLSRALGYQHLALQHLADTYGSDNKIPYVEAIIMESERMNSVIPLIAPRRISRNTTIDGYHIPKDTTLLVNFNSVHHDAEYWGDPNVFRPERFINKDGKLLTGERVLTFGLGKRRCLGELLARQCIFLFFTTILRKYKICPEPGVPFPSRTPRPGVTIAPQKYKAVLELRHL